MAEDEAMFDFSMKKKKKSKKTPFDLDAAMGDEAAEAAAPAEEEPAPAEPKKEAAADDELLDDDLSSLTKKKKKKKKPFDMGELDDALPSKDGEDAEGAKDDAAPADNLEDELGLDLKSKKKKKKKVVLLDDEADADDAQFGGEGDKDVVDDREAWTIDSDRDYTYDELLKRVFDIMREKNPDMVAGEKRKFNMKPPRVMRVGTKKTSFSNFKEICKLLHRQPEHLLAFLLAELGTSGSIDGNDQLIIKGRFQQKQIENVLRSYIKEYVTCHTCKSRETMLQKDTRLYFLQCETCGSRCSVQSIKSGFQAVTGKRAAMRAKTT